MANLVVLTGRLTRDPELRRTQSGMAVCTFTLAVDKGLSREKRQEAEAKGTPTADFPRITVWGKQGENVSQYLSKGSQCLVQGSIQTGQYNDQESGKTIYTTDVVGYKVEFLDSGNQGQQKQSNPVEDNDFFGGDFTENTNGSIPF